MRKKGIKFEKIASNYIEESGLRVITRNFNSRYGEIDLIAEDTSSDTIVFIEVKARTSNKFGTPEEAITNKKIKNIIKTSLEFISLMNLTNKNIRFDIITIEKDKDYNYKIKHIKNAIILDNTDDYE